jgi:hypothetical protein
VNLHCHLSERKRVHFRPVTVNGETACHNDSDCNGGCGVNPSCYWTCEINLCMYQTRLSWEAISNREAGIPDLPRNN